MNLGGTKTMISVKDNVLRMIQELPDDCSLEDVKYRIYLLERVGEGLTNIDAGRVMTQDEAEQEVTRWLRSSGRERQ
jgi:hypothetical protein